MPSDLELCLGLKGFKQPLSPSEASAAVTFGVPSPRNLPKEIVGRGRGCASPGGPRQASEAGREKWSKQLSRDQIDSHSRRENQAQVEPGTQPGEGVLAIC